MALAPELKANENKTQNGGLSKKPSAITESEKQGGARGQTGKSIYLAKEINVPSQTGIKITRLIEWWSSVPWRGSNAFSFRPNSNALLGTTLFVFISLRSQGQSSQRGTFLFNKRAVLMIKNSVGAYSPQTLEIPDIVTSLYQLNSEGHMF